MIPVLIVAVITFTIFLIFRRKFNKVYQPRSQAGIIDEEHIRTPADRGSFFKSIFAFKQLPDEFVLEHNSFDGYFFLRFFKLLIVISIFGCVVTWPILFPVNATGGGGQQQLDILSFSNVVNPNRYYAHTFIAWIYLGGVVFLITRERMRFIGLAQAYFLSNLRAKRLTSRTVLFMDLPSSITTEAGLRERFGHEVRNIWMVTDCKQLDDKVQDRDKAALKLEAAEVKLSQQAGKALLKSKKSGKTEHNNDPVSWLPEEKKMPTHRLKPLIGKKVPTVKWCQSEIPNMDQEIEAMQKNHVHGNAKFVNAAFVEFNNQAAAQRAYQLASKKKVNKERKFIDVQPEDVIWKNMSVSYKSRKAKMAIATVLVALLILFWTPIILFIGAVTNINYLQAKVPFLSFINSIPKVILGVITGLLPVIILAVCVILVPIIMRLLAKLAGEPTLSAVELKTQTWYFAFQVIQVFLITTFSSGASAVASQIVQNPLQAPQLLATNLPKASNFYISYLILFGLAQAASMLLNIVALALFLVLGRLFDKTPRKMYNRWIALNGVGWGSEYPKWTNLGVIVLSYSCIAPLILGFASIGFFLLYLAFRHQWLFVLGNKVDMKGTAYNKALKQLMWGVYLSAGCLIGLFGIGAAKAPSGAGPLVLMVIFLVIVVVFQVAVNYALKPLETALPLDLCSENSYDYDREADRARNQRIGSEDTIPNNQNTVLHEKHNLASQVPNTTVSRGSYTPPGNALTARLAPYMAKNFPLSRFSKYTFHLSHTAPYLLEPEAAYYNPSIRSPRPILWLARDPCGVSKYFVEQNRSVGIDTTDQYAWFDEKNKLQWDTNNIVGVKSAIQRDGKETGRVYGQLRQGEMGS